MFSLTTRILRTHFKSALDRFAFVPQFSLFAPQLAFPGGLPQEGTEDEKSEVTGSWIDQAGVWFAGPKSKIAPGQKRSKHFKYYPDRLEWVQCDRCGEAKLPHRMCTKHKDMCAMREEDYVVFKNRPVENNE